MKCHRKEDGIVPKPISFGQGDSAVNFDHSTHTAMAACSECHTKIFPMKKGSSKIGFAEHGAGKYCFSCHTGKKAFSWSKCTDCHSKRVPLPKDPITYRMKDAAPVNFSHEFHTQVFGCEQCHTKVWPMKKGIKKMTMDPMYEGKYCGVCHNEKDAFAATECDKCHIEQKKK
jgi:c(7)-type cytochrome triheme protein